MSNTMSDDTIQNRNELIALFDAINANPNGSPMSDENRPRIDPHTRQCIVTDVCLKRYLRDQFVDDGDEVFVKNLEDAPTRAEHLERLVGDIDSEDDVGPGMFEDFLNSTVDVPLFGATLSFSFNDNDTKDAVQEVFPSKLQGPVQLQPAETLHSVVMNENSNSLTSVFGTDGNDTGGYGLADNRIKYGLFQTWGLVNENAAEDTGLTDEEVERLDTLFWRSIKNQPTSRAKLGHEPRVYLRVEYEEETYQIGLQNAFSLYEPASEDDKMIRSPQDTCLDLTWFLNQLDSRNECVKTVHIKVDNQMTVATQNDGVLGGPEAMYNEIRDIVGDDSVHVIDVYNETPAN
jgi:CRISPR-associated protein Csh2